MERLDDVSAPKQNVRSVCKISIFLHLGVGLAVRVEAKSAGGLAEVGEEAGVSGGEGRNGGWDVEVSIAGCGGSGSGRSRCLGDEVVHATVDVVGLAHRNCGEGDGDGGDTAEHDCDEARALLAAALLYISGQTNKVKKLRNSTRTGYVAYSASIVKSNQVNVRLEFLDNR